MATTRKYKRPPIDPAEIKYIFTNDGRILAPDKLNNLVCINNGNTLPASSVVQDALALGEKLNSKGGINYDTTEKLLENYRFYSLTEKTKNKLKSQYAEKLKREPVNLSKHPIKLTVQGTEDIKDLVSLMADIKDLPPQIKKFVNKTNNIVLSANIISIIDEVIESFRFSGSEKFKDAAEILYAKYISLDFENATPEVLFANAGKLKHKYYTALDNAISLMSSTLFGVFPSDNNLLEINITDSGVQVKEIEN